MAKFTSSLDALCSAVRHIVLGNESITVQTLHCSPQVMRSLPQTEFNQPHNRTQHAHADNTNGLTDMTSSYQRNILRRLLVASGADTFGWANTNTCCYINLGHRQCPCGIQAVSQDYLFHHIVWFVRSISFQPIQFPISRNDFDRY